MNIGLLSTSDGLGRAYGRRRRCARFKRRLELEYRVDREKWEQVWRTGFSTNASAFGFCVASAFVPPPGVKLQVRMRLPGSLTLEMWGRVAWAEQASALSSRAPSTFGLELTAAPEAWFQYCYRMST